MCHTQQPQCEVCVCVRDQRSEITQMPSGQAFHVACPFTQRALCTCTRYLDVNAAQVEDEALLIHELCRQAIPGFEKEFGILQTERHASVAGN
ncbi:hypothetical protein DIPPA_00423 [Diplonema papillatum]|nr:hypothetical protein DIPPA_00423 [Diplonema papillatum]